MNTWHDPAVINFASDNHAGVHPDVLAAVAAANHGHQGAYGADAYTARLQDVVRDLFGPDAEAFPVFNGTGANVLALQSMMPRWGAAITATTAHVNTDENGAPERIGGIKLLTVPAADGRLTPQAVDREAWGWGDEHRAQPAVVSLTQATELGTCYRPEQIAALTDHAHGLGMRVHLDGARLANAAATLGTSLRALTTDVGVDVLSLGGTKNGLLGAEAVVVLDPAASEGLTYLRKMNMQLASKMRFVSAQLLALYEDDLWLRLATHANVMARRLHDAVVGLPGVEITHPVEANAVFATVPTATADRLRRRYAFYDWDRARGQVRWMCAFDTTPADVDAFAAALGEELTVD